MQNDGIWLSILEYSQLKNISVSTVRRYIKANRVKYTKENGKFSIFMNSENYSRYKETCSTDGEILELKLKIQELEIKNKTLKLENDELRMLVDLYEQPKVNEKVDLPELPVNA
jgi:hypothetical protein